MLACLDTCSLLALLSMHKEREGRQFIVLYQEKQIFYWSRILQLFLLPFYSFQILSLKTAITMWKWEIVTRAIVTLHRRSKLNMTNINRKTEKLSYHITTKELYICSRAGKELKARRMCLASVQCCSSEVCDTVPKSVMTVKKWVICDVQKVV